MPLEDDRVRLLGLKFDRSDIRTMVPAVFEMAHGQFRYIVTPNVDHLVRMQKSPDLRRIYRAAAICLCDSRVLALLARIMGLGRLTVVTGSDLTEQLARSGRLALYRTCIIGGSEHTIKTLKERFSLSDVVHYNPPYGFINDAAAVGRCVKVIVEADADIVFFAVGSPQQEILAYRVSRMPNVKGVGLCVGASFLFLSGEERRAPSWVQKSHLEWLFRLIWNPRRLWRRYLIQCPRIFGLLLHERATIK